MGSRDRLPERTARLTPETLPALHFFAPLLYTFRPQLYTTLHLSNRIPGPADRQKSYILQGLQEISGPPSRKKPTQKKCKAEKGTFHRIWMGVGRPRDFVTILNRFPPHDQLVTTNSNDRFVTTIGRKSTGPPALSARTFRSVPNFLTRRFEHLQAPSPRSAPKAAGTREWFLNRPPERSRRDGMPRKSATTTLCLAAFALKQPRATVPGKMPRAAQ
jgi:hypothetical protein